MGETTWPSFQLGDGAKLLLHSCLQLEAFEALQDHPHATISTLDGSDDPGVVGAGGFSNDVEARIGMRTDEMRVEGAELARSEKSVGAGAAIIHGPVEAL